MLCSSFCSSSNTNPDRLHHEREWNQKITLLIKKYLIGWGLSVFENWILVPNPEEVLLGGINFMSAGYKAFTLLLLQEHLILGINVKHHSHLGNNVSLNNILLCYTTIVDLLLWDRAFEFSVSQISALIQGKHSQGSLAWGSSCTGFESVLGAMRGAAGAIITSSFDQIIFINSFSLNFK